MQDLIPLYSADGELQDWISEKRMARLDGLGLIRIVQHKKGRVSRCILHRRPGEPLPLNLSVYLGTRYSYLERLDSGRLVWTLRKLRQSGAHTWPTLAWEDKDAISSTVVLRKRNTARNRPKSAQYTRRAKPWVLPGLRRPRVG